MSGSIELPKDQDHSMMSSSGEKKTISPNEVDTSDNIIIDKVDSSESQHQNNSVTVETSQSNKTGDHVESLSVNTNDLVNVSQTASNDAEGGAVEVNGGDIGLSKDKLGNTSDIQVKKEDGLFNGSAQQKGLNDDSKEDCSSNSDVLTNNISETCESTQSSSESSSLKTESHDSNFLQNSSPSWSLETSKTKTTTSTVASSSSSDGHVPMETETSPFCTSPDDGAKPSTSKTEAETVEGAAKNDKNAPLQSVYHVKWIQFKDNNAAIITQNENGPCPLLAIMNVLLLQGKVKLPAMIEMVTSGQLMEYLGDCIFEHAPKDISEDAQLNYEQNMHDAMAVFHKLQTGLDVNVKFTGVGDFEYTPECIVFDLLSIPLYHGWLVDPESPEVVAAIGNFSYNQLVEKIIVQKGSKREELMTEALIAEEFLDRTAHQLTYHGLSELVTTVKEDELCVFFRNNHFSTLYKHNNELFLLVTDQGFLTEGSMVWETLSNVEGDGHFVDANFRTYMKPEASSSPIAVPSIPVGSDQQIDQDYMVALSLQQEQQESQEAPLAWQPANSQSLTDHELAMRLQEEENRRAATMAHRQQQQPPQRQGSTTSSGSQKKKNSDVSDPESKSNTCTIL